MRPHTWTKPKPLINVAGKPFLGHLLEKFAPLDIDELIIIYGWLGDQIKAYLRENYSQYEMQFIEQRELKGQSHALWLAREHLEGEGIITYVDTFFGGDVDVLQDPPGDGLAFVKEVKDPRRFGVVELNEQGEIIRFIEKPDTKENKNVVIGLYWLHDLAWLVQAIEQQMSEDKSLEGEYYLADALQMMVDRGAEFHVHPVEIWQDAGKPETTLQTNRYLLDHGYDNHGTLAFPNAVIVPPVYVAPDAKIENAVVGPYANVLSGAEIRHAVVSNSIIDANAIVEDVVLEGSLIGEEAHVKGDLTRLNIGNSATTGFEYEVDESWQ
jgi:glucose-1-phosphate thymidylyltransferase